MVFFQTSGFLVKISITSEIYQAPYQGEPGWSEKLEGATTHDMVGSFPVLTSALN